MDESDEAGAGGDSTPTQPSQSRGGSGSATGSNVVAFPGSPKPPRRRHDGFTAAKQKKFFRALKKSGCLKDAAGAAGISTNTVRRHRDKWPEFDDKVESALAIASVELDMVAWKRATEGAQEKVYRNGELVFTRVKPSDMLLKMLVEGADPKKYGRGQTMPKRAVMKKLKKQADAEARARLRVGKPELIEEVVKLLAVLKRRRARERLAQGYALGPDGKLESP
ncbi:MAG TPA: hypothetical protein VEW71_06985 [Allosphingosinicella sp.]|nr:hypothetical protein [Allosphingosinicella sp.]